MKRSEELKIERKQKLDEMSAIVTGAKEAKRSITDDEQTKYDNLKNEVVALERQIEDAEFLETRNDNLVNTDNQHQAPITAPNIKREAAPYSVGKAMREFAKNGEDGLTGREKEQHAELSRGISSSGLLVPYNARAISANTTSTHSAAVDVNIDPNLSIIGKEPLWNKMGLTVLPNLQGTFKLGKKTPDEAENPSETTAISTESNVPTFVTMAPERFGISDLFTKELLAQENPAVQAAIVNDMIKSCDRKITSEVYTIALAAATEVSAGALTLAGFNALMKAVDIEGAFAMDRDSFFEAKAVKVDAGSGRFLATMTQENGVGLTYDGAKLFYSSLFADGDAKQYAIYGAWEEIYLGFWGALEILINPYTYQKQGEIEITVNKLADAVCRNSGAFVKTPDLDATT